MVDKRLRRRFAGLGRSFVRCACLGLLAVAAGYAFAQTTGRVEGTVVDESDTGISGASVELAGPRLQGIRVAVTSATGNYRFQGVPPGDYTVTASLPGFAKVQKTASVSSDGTATVALQLRLTASAEVTVSGQAPIVDTTSTTTGSNYNAKAINKLPIGRNYAEVVFLQPGVQADFGDSRARALQISIYGSTSAENLYLIDGINTTDVVRGVEGKDINNEFVEDVEVKAGGYQAEYGRNTGGVINVITKSGGNEFHGGAFGYYNDTAMRADQKNGNPANYDTPPYSRTGDAQFQNYVHSKDNKWELGADLGGYLWKDRIWFFGAYTRIRIEQNIQTLDVNNQVTFGHEFPSDYVLNKWAGKLTLNLGQSTTVVGSIFTDAQTQEGALLGTLGSHGPPTSLNPSTYGGRRDTGGPDYGARLNQLFGSFGIFSFQYARHSDRFATTPFDSSQPRIRDHTVDAFEGGFAFVDSGGFGQVFGPIDNNHSDRDAYAGSFTAYFGNHEIKLGGDYTTDTTSGSSYWTGGQRVHIRPCLQDGGRNQCDLSRAPIYNNGQRPTNPDGSPNPFFYEGPVFYQHDLLAVGPEGNPQVVPSAPFSASTKRYSGFIQDQWRATASLTINLGIRYDTESYYGQLADGTFFRAISLSNQWAPRIGFAWDFVGDGSSKLFGSVGRFYYSIPTDMNIRAFTVSGNLANFNYDPTSTDQDPAAPRAQLFQPGFGTGEPVDSGIKQSYLDEATLGIERAFGPTLSVGLKATYRALGRAVEDRCDLDYNDPRTGGNTCGIANPGGSGPVASGQLPVCDTYQNPTDPNSFTCGHPGVPMGPARRYFRGIELMAREQFSDKLWAQASFLYSSLIGNYSGAVQENTGQTDPGINADFDYYQFATNAYGRMELDRPVQARIDALYTSTFGLWSGISFYVRSGRPTSELGFFNDFYGDFLYLVKRGSSGRLPTDYDMNLSLGYDWDAGPVVVTPMLFVTNLFNRQTANKVNQDFNVGGTFVTDPSSPFYGQQGVQPGQGSCPASATKPCTDNPDYRKVTQRISPRLLRVALRITF